MFDSVFFSVAVGKLDGGVSPLLVLFLLTLAGSTGVSSGSGSGSNLSFVINKSWRFLRNSVPFPIQR